MPRATVDTDQTEKIDLKSCVGGYVALRRLTYGEFLQRREMVGEMKVRGDRKTNDFEGALKMINRMVTEFEFSHCITDHNLEDESGTKLNFANPRALDKLDPRIGEEIGTHIDKMNQYQEELGNSETGSGPPSS